MFKGLFKSARALARHRDAPLAEERARYIQHCMESGSTHLTIAMKCRELLWAAQLINEEDRFHIQQSVIACHSCSTLGWTAGRP